MGWSSGTYWFDGCVDIVLKFMPDANRMPVMIQAVVNEVYELFNGEDWDTQDESDYFKPYLANAMLVKGQIDQEEYDWHIHGTESEDWY
jgi:hypothetical protein